jgi:hypothetical protein
MGAMAKIDYVNIDETENSTDGDVAERRVELESFQTSEERISIVKRVRASGRLTCDL